MSNLETYTVTLEEDESGDLIMPIPDEIMEAMGLKIGDELSFEMNDDGSVSFQPVRPKAI
jgi:antitoxin component of MazEF toxin-antitoxin module